MNWQHKAGSGLLFQGIWWLAIFQHVAVAAVLVMIQLVHVRYTWDRTPGLRPHRNRLFGYSVALLSLGLAMDALLAVSGVLTFAEALRFGGSPLPVWIVIIWLSFVATFTVAMQWVVRQPALCGVFCLLGAPVSYLAGQAFGVVSLSPVGAVTLGLCWAAYGTFASVMYLRATKASSATNLAAKAS